MDTIYWLRANFPKAKPEKTIARSSIRHLKKIEKGQLFSKDLSQMRAAEGRWYESLIYEMVLDISKKTDAIKYVVKKGADAPFPPENVVMGQNGLYYSNRGDINVRGNGQDIAEFDIMLIDDQDRVCFAEIVTSASDLKDMEEEVRYKKALLGYLYGQVVVPFILFSSVDISRSSIMRRLVRETESALIITRPVEEIKTQIKPASIRGVPRKPIGHPKVIDLAQIPVKRPFDYKKLHDLKRDRLIGLMMAEKPMSEIMKKDEIPPVSKKVILGALYPSGIKALMRDRTFSMKGQVYDYGMVVRDFSKVVLAVDIPDYEPVVYLRSKKKNEYLKVVRKKSGELKVESKRTPQMTGFYIWLEDLSPSLGAKVTNYYADYFLCMPGKKK